ncbi:hypothetical protein PLESTF_001285500 [Pleodorina starrii]|nr:hypothetical protein PLESTM_001484600 [Pleodorina starrii]GLC72716.1 hypothetical protein PLESTF_001285500 [Pleodorina starrii]
MESPQPVAGRAGGWWWCPRACLRVNAELNGSVYSGGGPEERVATGCVHVAAVRARTAGGAAAAGLSLSFVHRRLGGRSNELLRPYFTLVMLEVAALSAPSMQPSYSGRCEYLA